MKKLAFLLFTILLAINAYSAFLRNVPVDLKQPDGTIIHCFITGDEFYRRVHDKDNFTIVQNPQTSYYVYALKTGEELIPSTYVVGQSDPKQVGIEPNLEIASEQKEDKRTVALKSAKIASENSTKGDFNNIVISIRFSDQNPTTLTLSDYEDKFNSLTGLSLKSYYKEVSNSQLNVSSSFYPEPQNQTILEYQDSHPRAYYTKYSETNNTIGYKLSEYLEREQNLIKNAIKSVRNEIIESQINIDINLDGFVDNLIFVIQGNPDSWGEILWPMSNTLIGSRIFIGSKQVSQYNKQLVSWLNADVISHEFFHSLGAPDLYRYTNKDIDPVGGWDIMGITGTQHMTTYMKWKYGKWFSTLPEITQPGTYTLKPVSQSPYACYKIPSPFNSTEYFMVEYRKKEGLLEKSIPSNYIDGLIIYRINPNVQWGNADGPPDELYIYREGGDHLLNGDISKAAFSSNSNRTIFSNESNPVCILSNGDQGWIDISNVTSTGNEISFTVNPVMFLPKPQNFIASTQNNQVMLKWKIPIITNQALIGYNVYLNGNSSPLNTSVIKDSLYLTPMPGQKAYYVFKLAAIYKQGKSDLVSCNFVNMSNPSVKDSLALVSLYNKCNGQNWTRKNNWLTGSIKTWQGITFENGRVVMLNLAGNNLSVGSSGQIPSELLDINELRLLDLSYNNLEGALPENWSAFGKLTDLWLQSNQFSGSLPESWSSLINLKQIQLSNNRLTGTLPESWSSLTKLVDFRLDNNQLTGSLPESWSTLINLNILDLSKNQLTGTLPERWSTLVNLSWLLLYDNQLSGNLPSSWSTLANLGQLNLVRNKLTGSLPSSWSALKNLWALDIGRNQLTGSLPESWSALTKLQWLLLYENQIGGTLPVSWSALVNMFNLDIGSNLIEGSLPESWSALTKLSILSTAGNLLSGTLPDSWSALKNLNKLTISGRIPGIPGKQMTGTLPDSWSALTNLNFLDLQINQFSGKLPDSWSALTNLEFLRLNDNMLTGSLPESWSSLIKLKGLALNNNKLTGSLPESWSAFVNLEELLLNYNQLSGSLPDSWSNLVNLKQMFLFDNQLSGNVPESWSSMVNLQYLYLGVNRISGLPKMLNLTNLVALVIDRNLLDFGDIEPNIGIAGSFYYVEQAAVGKADTLIKTPGEEFKVSVTVGGKSNKYKWFKNGISITGATGTEFTTPKVNSGDAGIYTCQITNTVATKLTLQSQPITLQILNKTDIGSEFFEKDKFKIYPNPTTGIVNLEISEGMNREGEIVVTNLAGAEVFRKEIIGNPKIQIDLSKQVNGIYMLKVVVDNYVYISKIVVRKK